MKSLYLKLEDYILCNQSYYCLESKQGTILSSSELIQMCINHLVRKGERFGKDKVVEIVVDRKRYFVSSNEVLLELIVKIEIKVDIL